MNKTFVTLALSLTIFASNSAFAQLTITPGGDPSSAVAQAPKNPATGPTNAQLKVDKDGKISMEGAPSGLTITPVGQPTLSPAKAGAPFTSQLAPISKPALDGYSSAYNWGPISGVLLAIGLGAYARRRITQHEATDVTQGAPSNLGFKSKWAAERTKKSQVKKARKSKNTIRLMG